MIIDKTVKIKGNGRNLKHFKNLNYDIKINEYIDVETKDLLKTCHVKINVECDICKTKREISYFSYHRNVDSEENLYTCPKCSKIKKKKTNLKKYGVEYPIQLKEIVQKRKDNNIKKYGVDEPAKLQETKNKAKNTKKEKYGDENFINYEKIKITKKEKYNDENYNNREKNKLTCLKKYGVKNVSEIDGIKNKKAQTFIKNYNVDNYSKSDKYKNNIDDFILDKYKNLNIIDCKNDTLTLPCDCKKDHNFEIKKYILRNRIIYKTILCTICNPVNSFSTSGLELQLQNFIEEYYIGKIIYNTL